MKTIAKHIEYLLSRNDCVIIPGFGAVLAYMEGARFDYEAGVAYPPRRNFTFNGSLTVSDGTLANSIARAEGTSLPVATDRISREVDIMMSRLRNNGTVSLGRIGDVNLNADGALHFHPSETDTISASTAWLPIVAPRAEEAIELPQPVDRVASPMARFARVAASIALLFAIYFVASTPISVDQAALAALTPEIKHTPIEEFMPADLEPISNMSIFGTHNPDAAIDVDAIPAYCYASVTELKDNGSNYLVIVCSCVNMAEAERFIENRKNHSLRFIEQDGRFRVFAAAFATEAEAYRNIRDGNYGEAGAWVCHIR